MRVLWAGQHRPDRLRGGGWSAAHELLVAGADAGHDITVLCGEVGLGENLPELAAAGIAVWGVPWQPNVVPRSKLGFLRRLVVGPGTIGFWRSAPCASALAAEVAARERLERFDLVCVFAGEMASVAAAATAPVALLLCDSYARQLERERRVVRGKQRVIASLEARQARRWERTRYADADALGCVAEDDAIALRSLTGRPVTTLPLPIGDEWFERSDRPRRTDVVTFAGALDYAPNIDAAAWFVDEVGPRVLAAAPGTRLRIVGRNLAPELRVRLEASKTPFELHLDVPDMRPYYWETSVAAMPLRLGSGVKTKVLHAIACDAPLVATPVAVEGTGARDGVHALVRADAATFADAVLECLRSPAEAATRAEHARSLVDQHRRGAVSASLDGWWRRAAGAAP